MTTPGHAVATEIGDGSRAGAAMLTRTAGDERLRVLLVDDSLAVRQLVGTRLRGLANSSLHLDVELAESGEQALALAANNAYDVVFLDVQMPGLDGYETCRRLKQIRPTRVAMLSAMASPVDHAAGREAGCDNYLVKPPHDTDLRSVLRLALLRKITAK